MEDAIRCDNGAFASLDNTRLLAFARLPNFIGLTS